MARPGRETRDPGRDPSDPELEHDPVGITFGSGLQNTVAAIHLMKELTSLNRNPIEGISCGLKDDKNLYVWNVCITGPPDSPYQEGLFQAELVFPDVYPNYPPKMKFTSEMWHPNIYADGRVCISILHPPGADRWGYEDSAERWRPINNVESILLCVQCMLGEPNDQSPANIEAAVMWRNKPQEFKKKVAQTVRKSQEAMF
ncbi:MAG: putative Ubiquitin-conjugating enzyme E2 7 [Streblomastix strix]|uniref:Putative Ubiquitin-conjugating enzyme E2 7 n=1 Tax=Streblomastix strix TaxID=222440 RepID=A0A5J4WS27_9EUKA|nr:MAG: putative Ubiquitin-conjugating enzyme E2 7 [Streblomastix strix]